MEKDLIPKSNCPKGQYLTVLSTQLMLRYLLNDGVNERMNE